MRDITFQHSGPLLEAYGRNGYWEVFCCNSLILFRLNCAPGVVAQMDPENKGLSTVFIQDDPSRLLRC